MSVAGCPSRSVTSPALGSLGTIKWTGQDHEEASTQYRKKKNLPEIKGRVHRLVIQYQ